MKGIFFLLFILVHLLEASSFDELLELGLIKQGQAIKLHLGCGETRIKDYINIDFPSTDHTVQIQEGADFFFDITKLSFPSNSINEVRNHHVFEHFSRSKALALLTAWHLWLQENGILYIETPDFQASIEQLVRPEYSFKEKQAILRHIFGSQEAGWAIHYDGWYLEKYITVLKSLGFKIIASKKTKHKVISNITIHAKKTTDLSLEELKRNCKMILSYSLVDESLSEIKMLDVWYQEYLNNLKDLGLD